MHVSTPSNSCLGADRDEVWKDVRAVEQHNMRIACATMQQLSGLLLMVPGTLKVAKVVA